MSAFPIRNAEGKICFWIDYDTSSNQVVVLREIKGDRQTVLRCDPLSRVDDDVVESGYDDETIMPC